MVFFFSRFSHDATNSDHQGDGSVACYLPESMGDNISQEGVFQQLLSLDTKKASGPDEIATPFFEALRGANIALQIVFRKFFRTHSVPCDWHKAVIIPVVQSGD